MAHTATSVVTVTLNPAIDLTVFVPGFAAGRVNRATGTESHAGGKGVNVASCLADYGMPTVATGFLGAENDGIFAGHFARKGIGDRFLRIPGMTRTGIKLVDETRQATTDVNFQGLQPAAEDLDQLLRLLDELAADHSWFVLSGSLPAGVPAGFYATAIERIRRRGGRTALDTSGEALRMGIAAAPVIKPNIDEFRALTGAALATVDETLCAARRLLAGGIRTAVVSMGRDGAVFAEATEAVLARPPSIDVRSTVAAGDAMVAGLLAGELSGRDLAGRARLATAFSLNVLSRIGAGLDRQLVEEFERAVTVEVIAAEAGARGGT